MTRKMLTAAFVVLAVLLSSLSLGSVQQDAEAQGSATCPYDLAELVRQQRRNPENSDFTVTVRATGDIVPCNEAKAYPGPFTNMPAAPVGAYGWGKLNIVAGAGAAAAPATGGGDATAGLAHTGSESTVLGYVGTGLIAFGAVALGSRRKFFQGALED